MSELENSIDNTDEPKSFKEISWSIKQELRSGNELPPEPPLCKNQFELIKPNTNYDRLVEYIKIKSNKIAFNYNDFLSQQKQILTSNYGGMAGTATGIVGISKQFSYRNSSGKTQQSQFNASLNTRHCYVNLNEWFYSIILNDSKEIIYRFYLPFFDTIDKIKPITETAKPNDYNINVAYCAFILETKEIEDFLYLWKIFYTQKEFYQISLNYLKKVLDEILKGFVGNTFAKNEDKVLDLLKNIAKSYVKKENFLHFLLEKITEEDTRLSLLFYRIDGDNFVALIKFLWSVWKESRFIYPDIENNPEYKETTGPLFLPYRAEKSLGFYFTSLHVGKINSDKVQVEYVTETSETETKYSVKDNVPIGIKQVEIENNVQYHPYYPVYLLKTDNKQDFVFEDLKNETIIPMFLLYANENKSFWQNWQTAGEYTIDIVTTVSGVGNIIKFRHLGTLATKASKYRFVSKTGKALATAKAAAAGTAAVVEISSGTINILLKLTSFDGTEQGQALNEFLFYLELLSLSGELTVAIANGLRKSAKKLVEKPENAAKLEKQLDDAIAKGELDEAGKQKVLDELYEVAEVERKLGDFIMHSGDDISESFIKSIVKQVRESTGLKNFDIHLIDRNNEKYKKLFDQWQKGGGHGFFKPTSGEFGIPLYKGLFGEGPQIYMFAGKTLDEWGFAKNVFFTKYTTQHELFHVEMFMYLKNKTPNYMKYWAEIPNYMHEQYVLNRLLKTKNWKKEDLLSDLENINGERVKKYKLNPITLKELETWKFEIELEKISIKIK